MEGVEEAVVLMTGMMIRTRTQDNRKDGSIGSASYALVQGVWYPLPEVMTRTIRIQNGQGRERLEKRFEAGD